MTVLELISTWTEEERDQHADLIAECLEREKMLIRIREGREDLAGDLKRSLDQFICGLTQLTLRIHRKAAPWGPRCLYVAKEKASA